MCSRRAMWAALRGAGSVEPVVGGIVGSRAAEGVTIVGSRWRRWTW